VCLRVEALFSVRLRCLSGRSFPSEGIFFPTDIQCPDPVSGSKRLCLERCVKSRPFQLGIVCLPSHSLDRWKCQFLTSVDPPVMEALAWPPPQGAGPNGARLSASSRA
jgi:hypothetical protein